MVPYLLLEIQSGLESSWLSLKKAEDRSDFPATIRSLRNIRGFLNTKTKFLKSIGILEKQPARTIQNAETTQESCMTQELTESEAKIVEEAARILNRKAENGDFLQK